MSNNNGDTPASPFDRNDSIWQEAGLTKREHFAGLAMQGLLASNAMYGGSTEKRGALARDAIAHAEVLLEELDKG